MFIKGNKDVGKLDYESFIKDLLTILLLIIILLTLIFLNILTIN